MDDDEHKRNDIYKGYSVVTLHPGRKRIYPLGLVTNNVPGILFSSQSCHNYDSTPGTRVEIEFLPLEKVCIRPDLSLFCFLKKKTTKKNQRTSAIGNG